MNRTASLIRSDSKAQASVASTGPFGAVSVRERLDRPLLQDDRQVIGTGLMRRTACIVLAMVVAGLGVAPSSAVATPIPIIGLIIGAIDGISRDGEQSYVSGWACQRGVDAPIKIHVYMDGGADRRPERVKVADGEANFDDEPTVDEVCGNATGHAHRFLVLLAPGTFDAGRDRRLYVPGIRLVDGVPNDAIPGSGSVLPQIPGPAPPHPVLPAIGGHTVGPQITRGSSRTGPRSTASQHKSIASGATRARGLPTSPIGCGPTSLRGSTGTRLIRVVG